MLSGCMGVPVQTVCEGCMLPPEGRNWLKYEVHIQETSCLPQSGAVKRWISLRPENAFSSYSN